MSKLLIAVLVLACVTGSVVATPTPTATSTVTSTATDNGSASSSNRSVVGQLPGDPAVTIIRYRHSSETGLMTVWLETSTYRVVRFTSSEQSAEGLATGYIKTRQVSPGEVVRVRIRAPSESVAISTGFSESNGKFGVLSASSSSALIGGPYSSKDIVWAGAGAGLGTAVGALIVVVRRQLGLHRGMERVA